MAQTAVSKNFMLAVSDNPEKQESKSLVYKVYKFNTENEASWTFEKLFSDAIAKGIFVVACSDQGLLIGDAIHIKGKDIEGESLTLSVTDSNSMLCEYFMLFSSISQIIFRLNAKVKVNSGIPESARQRDVKMFEMFSKKNPPCSDNADQQGFPKKHKSSTETETPMTREMFKQKRGLGNQVTPNIDNSWDIVVNWMVEECDFHCSLSVANCVGHLMYQFIDDFCLLLSQIGPRWSLIVDNMSFKQRQVLINSHEWNKLMYEDVNKPRCFFAKNNKTSRTNYHQKDCADLLRALTRIIGDTITNKSKYSTIFDEMTGNIYQMLIEISHTVKTRIEKLTSEVVRTKKCKVAESSHIMTNGLHGLMEFGALEVLYFGGSPKLDTPIRDCHKLTALAFTAVSNWDFISLDSVEPDDKDKRHKFYDIKKGFSLGAKVVFVLLRSSPNCPNQRFLHYLLKLPFYDNFEIIMNLDNYKDAVKNIKNEIPTIVSRLQKKYIRDCVTETVGGNALDVRLLERMMFPNDGSSSRNKREEALDKMQVLKLGGVIDSDTVNDLRELNGCNEQFEPFYQIADEILANAEQTASSSRHGSDIIDAKTISSIAELHRQAVEEACRRNAKASEPAPTAAFTAVLTSNLAEMGDNENGSTNINNNSTNSTCYVKNAINSLTVRELKDLTVLNNKTSLELPCMLSAIANQKQKLFTFDKITVDRRVLIRDFGVDFDNAVFDPSDDIDGDSKITLRLNETFRCLYLSLGILLNINPAILLFVFGAVMRHRLDFDASIETHEDRAMFKEIFEPSTYMDFDIVYPCYVKEMRPFKLIVVGIDYKQENKIVLKSIKVVSDPTYQEEKQTIIVCYNGYGHFVSLVDEDGSSQKLGEFLIRSAKEDGISNIVEGAELEAFGDFVDFPIDYHRYSVSDVMEQVQVRLDEFSAAPVDACDVTSKSLSSSTSSCRGQDGTPTILPIIIKIPTVSHFRLQFIPTNPTANAASRYMGRFNYNLRRQRNCIHLDHKDFDFTQANTRYVHQWLIDRYQSLLSTENCDVLYLETDDKNKVNVCEPGYILSAHQKPTKLLTKVKGEHASKDQGLADHDAGGSKSKLIPTVYLVPDLSLIKDPNEDSLYTGRMLVSVKDSIFSESTVALAKVNLSTVVKSLVANPAVIIVKSDGGSEHNFKHAAAFTASAAWFLESNTDFMVLVKSCPKNSWVNLVERCMSILNLALAGAVFSRPKLKDERNQDCQVYEAQIKASDSQKDLRERVAKHIGLKESVQRCYHDLAVALEDRFRRFKFKGRSIEIAPKSTNEDYNIFFNALSKIDATLPDIIKEKGLSDKRVPGLMQAFKDSDHCHSRTYTLQFSKTCWKTVAQQAIDRGEDPDNLPDDACNHCPFGCLRPNIPLSTFATIPWICSPLKASSSDPESDYLPYHQASQAISDNFRKDEENLPVVLNNDPLKSWSVAPINVRGELFTKTNIQAKEKLRGVIRCSECGKPRAVFTTAGITCGTSSYLKLSNFLELAFQSSFKCGDDLTQAALDFGIEKSYIPYTRLQVGVGISFSCSAVIEEVLYNFGRYQSCCYVCGTDDTVSVEKSANKPLCPDCSGKGWPLSLFKATKTNKLDDSQRKRTEKVDNRIFFGTLPQKKHIPDPLLKPSSKPSSVAPVVLNNESIRTIVGESQYFKMSIRATSSTSFMNNLISEIKKCGDADARRKLLATKQIFSVFMKKPLQGSFDGHHPDGFCYWVSEASAFYGHTIFLDNMEHRQKFIQFYRDIFPTKLGSVRINKSIENPLNKPNRPGTMKLLVEKVVEQASVYPTQNYTTGLYLKPEYWGGAEALSRFSHLLGNAKENKHITYWHTDWNTADSDNDLSMLQYLIGPSASVEYPGTCDAWFDRCGLQGWSIENMMNAWTGICFNNTFDGVHYYPCKHEGNDLTSEFVLAEVEVMSNDWLVKLENTISLNIDSSVSALDGIEQVDEHKSLPTNSLGSGSLPSKVSEIHAHVEMVVASKSNGTDNQPPILSHLHGIKEGKDKAAKILPMALQTDDASIASAEFSKQNFSHLECNNYLPPSSQAMCQQVATNISTNGLKNKAKRKR